MIILQYSAPITPGRSALMYARLQTPMGWLLFRMNSPCVRFGPIARCAFVRNLRTRFGWWLMLPEYGEEKVTWWHVFGLRRFKTPVPPPILGVCVDPAVWPSERRMVYFWDENDAGR